MKIHFLWYSSKVVYDIKIPQISSQADGLPCLSVLFDTAAIRDRLIFAAFKFVVSLCA
ncbi:hypothetical protein VCR9J2_960059 [Vibrio crassostreae]|nr:hypothetical protein VCR9J2_960059 [Vibrio crassostreae]